MSDTGRDNGQAAVELALAMPIVVLLLLAIVQVVLVSRDQIAVIHAAREGARAAAVGDDASHAARDASGLVVTRLNIARTTGGGRVRVTVHYRSPTDVPLVGLLVGDVAIEATTTMELEP